VESAYWRTYGKKVTWILQFRDNHPSLQNQQVRIFLSLTSPDHQGELMHRLSWIAPLFLLLPASLGAQVNPYKDGTPGLTGFRSEVTAEVMIQQDKFVRLAQAIPAEKYTWRPAPDVRSIAEVFLHVCAANYNLYKLVGTAPPTGVDVRALEKSTTDKTKIIAALQDSFAHARKAITAMSDADLDKSLDWFGGKNTERGILLFVTRHAAEHLGQSIAYTRMVGVVPPWTEDAQKPPNPEAKEAAKPKR
jgi:uncharacterized damage-inducible protein DinB